MILPDSASIVRVIETLPGWQATILLIGVSLGSALLLEFVVLRALLRYTSRTKTQYDYILVGELRLPIVLSVALTGVFLLTQFPTVVDSVLLTPEQLNTFFGKPSLSVILIAWALAANRIVNRFVEEVKDHGSQFDFAPVFSNVWTLLVLVGTIGLLLSIWEYSVTPLLGAAGIAGIAIGFAAKDTVANFFGGIALYFDDTYKLGDYITLDSGEAGTVVDVGVRSTTLLTRDEVLITVPNSVLNAAKLVNQSAPQQRKRLKLPLGIAYGTDIDTFEELVLQIAGDEDLVLESPAPRMRFRNFGDSALEYDLLCWVRSPTSVGKARHELNRSIYHELQRAGIEIPFPQREVRVTSPDPTIGTSDTTHRESMSTAGVDGVQRSGNPDSP